MAADDKAADSAGQAHNAACHVVDNQPANTAPDEDDGDDE